MSQFKVVERQVRFVAYQVEADDADSAWEHVQMLGANEFDEEVCIDDTSILYVEDADGVIVLGDTGYEADAPDCQHRDDGRGVCIDCGQFLPTADGKAWA